MFLKGVNFRVMVTDKDRFVVWSMLETGSRGPDTALVWLHVL